MATHPDAIRLRISTIFSSLVFSVLHGFDVRAESLCLNRPISFAHYEYGLLYTEARGGIDEDVRRELAQRSGCKFTTSLRPRARIWLELESGSLDMAGSGIQTPGRDKFAWFAHYVVEDNYVHLGPNVPVGVNSMEAFLANHTLTMGGVRSYSYSPDYDRLMQTLVDAKRLHTVVDLIALYRMFEKGRIDAFIAPQFLSMHYFKILKLTPPERIQDWDHKPPTPSGLVISKRTFTPAQAEGWQRLMAQMVADGTIRKILINHLGEVLGPPAVFAGQ